jgi:endo-1,4-beta-xylanase
MTHILRLLGLSACVLALEPALCAEPGTSTIRGAYADDFLIGVALNSAQVDGRNAKAGEIAARQFSAITPENELKWQSVHPQPDRYEFRTSDAYAEFSKKKDMKLIGHTLVWHSQTPDWVFQGETGESATREILLKRMREHIHTVVGRYKGRIKGWDVVNEALSDGGPNILRDSPWRKIIGDDFIDQAFRFAREADPDAELYYNDYGLENERKRDNCVRLMRGLIERGVPISGVGTQSHFHLDHPAITEVEKTIQAFSGLGIKVMITELDVDVLPSRGNFGNADISRREQGDDSLNPYKGGLPAEIQEKLAKRYGDLFEVYMRHRKSISRVTFWGLDDGQSWLNNFPIQGRTNYPLLIDRELKPKPAFFTVLRKGGKGAR